MQGGRNFRICSEAKISRGLLVHYASAGPGLPVTPNHVYQHLSMLRRSGVGLLIWVEARAGAVVSYGHIGQCCSV